VQLQSGRAWRTGCGREARNRPARLLAGTLCLRPSAEHVADDLKRLTEADESSGLGTEVFEGHVFISSFIYEPAVPVVSVALAAFLGVPPTSTAPNPACSANPSNARPLGRLGDDDRMPRGRLHPYQVWLIGVPLNLLLAIPCFYPVAMGLLLSPHSSCSA